MYHFIGAVSRGPIRHVFRFRSTGEEHLPRQGGFVLSANHHSNFDPWPLGSRSGRSASCGSWPSPRCTPPVQADPEGSRSVSGSSWRGRRGGDRKAIELAKAVRWSRFSRRGRGATRALKKFASRGRAVGRSGRAARGRPARAGGDRWHGAPDEARPAAGRLRPADRPLGPGRGRHPPRAAKDRHRAPDGAIYRSKKRCEPSAPRRRRGLARAPRLPRAPEVDQVPTPLVGFTNMLVRLWESEEPRAVFVGWDTLTVPTYRHEALAGYQAGRVFDKSLLEQLDMLPELVRSLGFAAAKEDGYEADDFLGAAVRYEEKSGGTAVVATSDRDSFQLASDRRRSSRPCAGSPSSHGSGPRKFASGTASSPSRFPTSSHSAATRPTRSWGRRASAPRRRLRSSSSTAPSTPRSARAGFRTSGRSWSSTGELPHSTPPLLSLP